MPNKMAELHEISGHFRRNSVAGASVAPMPILGRPQQLAANSRRGHGRASSCKACRPRHWDRAAPETEHDSLAKNGPMEMAPGGKYEARLIASKGLAGIHCGGGLPG